MNETSSHFETVFREVTEYFADIPHITVLPGEGTPAEQYTIIYQIPGVCREGDNSVSRCDKHIVSIALPVNFPNAPPLCLPESATFHPDFTSSAIHTGDVWEREHSVTKLILHIGRMISGEVYSTTGALNGEAARWYESHSDDIPFDGNGSKQDAATLLDIVSDDINPYKIDYSDDDEFAQAFSLEESKPSDDSIDKGLLDIMARQKRFHALSEILKKTDEQFTGRAELEEQTRSSLNEAMGLFQEANDLEHQGQQQKALEKFQAIEELVSDYPLLHKAKKRVQQAFDLLGDWVSEAEKGKSSDSSSAASTPPSREQAFAQYKKEQNIKRLFQVLGGCALFLAVLALSSYLFLDSRLKKAEGNYLECQSLLNSESFKDAETRCKQALKITKQVYFVKQDRKKELDTQIRSLLDSSRMQQGLAGKTLLDGKYVSHAQKELILAFREAMKNGDSLFAGKGWYEASLSYNRALSLANEAHLTESDAMGDLHEKIARTKIYLAIEKGKKSFSASRWNDAINQYKKAISLIEKNAALLGKQYVNQTSQKLATILLHATIVRDRQRVTQQLQGKQYGQALKQLQRIQENITSSEFASLPQFQAILKELVAQVEDTKNDFLIFKQETYLIENYKELFLKHYPSTAYANLSTPRVTFLKEIGGKLLFRMQCTEKTGGRSLRLQMNYLYSPTTGTWRFYGEN